MTGKRRLPSRAAEEDATFKECANVSLWCFQEAGWNCGVEDALTTAQVGRLLKTPIVLSASTCVAATERTFLKASFLLHAPSQTTLIADQTKLCEIRDEWARFMEGLVEQRDALLVNHVRRASPSMRW